MDLPGIYSSNGNRPSGGGQCKINKIQFPIGAGKME